MSKIVVVLFSAVASGPMSGFNWSPKTQIVLRPLFCDSDSPFVIVVESPEHFPAAGDDALGIEEAKSMKPQRDGEAIVCHKEVTRVKNPCTKSPVHEAYDTVAHDRPGLGKCGEYDTACLRRGERLAFFCSHHHAAREVDIAGLFMGISA